MCDDDEKQGSCGEAQDPALEQLEGSVLCYNRPLDSVWPEDVDHE